MMKQKIKKNEYYSNYCTKRRECEWRSMNYSKEMKKLLMVQFQH
ncbi:hypothetical protein [Sporosarcina sp. P33]|nr:hypothetical protein [Sporosarcina sp. P33]